MMCYYLDIKPDFSIIIILISDSVCCSQLRSCDRCTFIKVMRQQIIIHPALHPLQIESVGTPAP